MLLSVLAILHIIFQYGNFNFKQNDHMQQTKTKAVTATTLKKRVYSNTFIEIASAWPYFSKHLTLLHL